MEIGTKNGSKIKLETGSEFKFGRESIPDSNKQTISRNHITLKLNNNETKVNFKVNGKNPVWVHKSQTNEIKVYKKMETGEMETGDKFCVCSNNPVWFYLNKIQNHDEFDHVKEFNFVVIGHEFDCYPKKMIRDIKNWDWFLEEPKQDSDDDEGSDTKRKKGLRRKRKKSGKKDDEDDDVWTGESEEDVEVIKKIKNDVKPKYSTRSKKQAKNKKGSGASTSKNANDDTKMYGNDEDDEDDDNDDDENDETLGGFIVDEEDVGEGNDEDDEEEEFDEDEDEDD